MRVHVDKTCVCRVDNDVRQTLVAGKRYDGIPAKEARRLQREGCLVIIEGKSLEGKSDGNSV